MASPNNPVFRMPGVVLCHGTSGTGESVFRFLDPLTMRLQAILLATGENARRLTLLCNTQIVTTVQGVVVPQQAGVLPLVRVALVRAPGLTATPTPGARPQRGTPCRNCARPAGDPLPEFADCVAGCLADKAGDIAIAETIGELCDFGILASGFTFPSACAAIVTSVAELPAAIVPLVTCLAAATSLSITDVVGCMCGCSSQLERRR